jgi:hypothetical protein
VGIEPGTASPIVVSGEALLQTETCAAFGMLILFSFSLVGKWDPKS